MRTEADQSIPIAKEVANCPPDEVIVRITTLASGKMQDRDEIAAYIKAGMAGFPRGNASGFRRSLRVLLDTSPDRSPEPPT